VVLAIPVSILPNGYPPRSKPLFFVKYWSIFPILKRTDPLCTSLWEPILKYRHQTQGATDCPISFSLLFCTLRLFLIVHLPKEVPCHLTECPPPPGAPPSPKTGSLNTGNSPPPRKTHIVLKKRFPPSKTSYPYNVVPHPLNEFL